MIKRRSSESGYTLLEVVIALLIIVVGLAAYYQAFGSGILAGASAEKTWRAARAADNLLVQLGRSISLTDGTTSSGEFADGAHWRLRIEAFSPAESTESTSPIHAHIVTLNVSRANEEGDPIRVRTLVITSEPK